MKILDKYLLKKFLKTYVFAVFVIVLVILVIDYVEKNDDFIQKNAPTSEILLTYYANLAPYWANYISPLMIFISTVFFTAKLAAHSEIIAILTSGVSFRRLMFPYAMGALLIGLFSFVMVGWILPKANAKRIAFENQYINDTFFFSDRDFHMTVAPDTYVYFSTYNNQSKTAFDFTIEKFEGNELIEKLSARRAMWIDSLAKWRIYDYRIREIGIMKDELTIDRQYVDSTLSMYPTDFESSHGIQETFTINELNSQIDLLRSRGSEGIEPFLIERYQRYATPFAVLILSLMALIVSARKRRGGVGLQIAIGFVLAFTYILFYIMSKGIAESGNMNPLLAVWLPNIVFSVIATFMYFTVPR
ncbi:LptF/LptG family permease [Jiulongibacter sediminis]|jgi:lipopolysaccharide export system permease protein|uniref:Permease n=1 Tax=Jiulongibacter sediminis TaxID=1605367 RepID=A0A0P7BJ38_9BACT|nr:LptF/LptG family permease [Jiulongibacter sediminis]KPM47182.1 permease [Jiulongibacter sediminis]TBX22740.1 permease [Jiulongibacter sediminis]